MDARPPAPPRSALLAHLAETPLSYAIGAVNVLALAWVQSRGSPTDPQILVAAGALERGQVWAGEPWRLVTAAFLHAGWLHLAWNTIGGVPGCRLVERALGPAAFLVLYLASAVGGSALSLVGQDVISAGASGALFGVAGAALVLHRRTVGSWRAFVRSGATRLVLAILVAWSVAVSLVLDVDHLAHAGGLAFGAGAAWLLSRPGGRRALPWAAYGAVLAALVVAACWPRPGLSRFEADRLETALGGAIRAGDALEAHRLLDRADAAGHASDALAYYRSYLRVQEGDLEGALATVRTLVGVPDRALRGDARRLGASVAKTLGYRHYTGDGAPRNPAIALSYLEEACSLGDAESCRNAARIRAP
jgi:membrane associated rhomboid family serine protease